MSTSNHPQTDGQTERMNRTIEEMLRAYVSPHHDDWDKHLVSVEFAINNTDHTGTGFTPFQLNSGQDPHVPMSLVAPVQQEVTCQAANDFVVQMARDLELAKDRLAVAQERQAKYANARRRDHTFKVNDWVLLSRKFLSNLSTAAAGATNLLSYKWFGPFKVLEVINDVSCRLELPDECKFHPVIHASYLEPVRDGSHQFPDREMPKPDPEIEDGEEYWKVEAFRNHDWKGRGKDKFRLLVKWEGYPEEDNTWKTMKSLREDLGDTFDDLLQQYKSRMKLPDGFEKSPTLRQQPKRKPRNK